MRYCKSTSFQANHNTFLSSRFLLGVVCDTAKVRVFKQITTHFRFVLLLHMLFAILQKYEFSSKSQLEGVTIKTLLRCLRYCKSTSFQANHNKTHNLFPINTLFAILQKYEFSSKSQLRKWYIAAVPSCLRYCKSTSFQANHNRLLSRQTTSLLFAILQKYEFSSKSQQFFGSP